MSVGERSGPRVLFLPLERTMWRTAFNVSYASQMGLEEGLAHHGVSFLTLPVPWWPYAREICGSQVFDQVWVEVSHQGSGAPEWAEWLASRAPVRLGFVMESLDYAPGQLVLNPEFGGMRSCVEGWLPYLTHIAMLDEADTAQVQATGQVQAVWWPQAVPARTLREFPLRADHPFAVFAGSRYGERQVWLDRPDLEEILVTQSISEKGTAYPALFDGLHRLVRLMLDRRMVSPARLLPVYLDRLRWLRRRCFDRWLASMQVGCAVVNLPANVKAYAGRVVEAMAAGRPVISWEVPERPRTRALFRDAEEILLFPRSEPARLAEQIRRIVREPEFGAQIVENARRKVRRFHTMEHRVDQLLEWVAAGTEPVYD